MKVEHLAIAGAVIGVVWWVTRSSAAAAAPPPSTPPPIDELPSCSGQMLLWEYKVIDGRCYWVAECADPEEVLIHQVDMAWCASAPPP